MAKKQEGPASVTKTGRRKVLISRQGLIHLLSQYENKCKKAEDIKSFIDDYFEKLVAEGKLYSSKEVLP